MTDLVTTNQSPTLLLHVCCAPCATHVVDVLRAEYRVTCFFCNPNIEPDAEYAKRLGEAERYLDSFNVPLTVDTSPKTHWEASIAGLEDEPEGGKRCEACYRYRLEQTARKAVDLGYDYFATTLTISPHKRAALINAIGQEIAENIAVHFLQADFKKKDGYRISCEMSRDLGLYRQTYCGCRFSQRRLLREE